MNNWKALYRHTEKGELHGNFFFTVYFKSVANVGINSRVDDQWCVTNSSF